MTCIPLALSVSANQHAWRITVKLIVKLCGTYIQYIIVHTFLFINVSKNTSIYMHACIIIILHARIHVLTHDSVASSAPANWRFRAWNTELDLMETETELEINAIPLKYKIIPRQRRNRILKNVV